MAAASRQGASLPSRGGGDLATPVAAARSPVERSNLIAKGLPPPAVATISQSARASKSEGPLVGTRGQ